MRKGFFLVFYLGVTGFPCASTILLCHPLVSLLLWVSTPPDGEPNRKLAVVDAARGGGNNLCMLIAYVYGEDVYTVDVIFNNGDIALTRRL